MFKHLSQSFYRQPTLKIAQELLSKFLFRQTRSGLYVGKIVETEAYLGEKDLACHSSKGRSKRNEIMFGPPGRAYVYFIYGMHYCLNIVTEEKENPCAVLIRALEPVKTTAHRGIKSCAPTSTKQKFSVPTTNGPAKLCRGFQIDKKLNGWNLCLGERLWLENNPDKNSGKIKIIRAKRIGVDYAGKYKDKLWRFYIKGNQFVSKK